MSPRNAVAYQGQRHYVWQGEKYPSVTTILQSYPKPWLGAWAAKFVAQTAVNELHTEGGWPGLDPEAATQYLKGSPWRKRNVAADFGTALHTALGSLVAGKPPLAEGEVAEHIEALAQWWAAYRPLVYDSEVQVFNLLEQYAGSLDLIAEVYGRRLLIDLKSGNAIDHDVRLQLAAYRYSEFIGENDQRIADTPSVDGCAVLHIPRDRPGDWQFIEVRAGSDEFYQFLTLKRIHQFIRDNKEAAIGELILPQMEEIA